MTIYRELVIHLKEETMKDIELLVIYQNAKTLLFHDSKQTNTIEDFVTGCIHHYIDRVKHQIDLSGINDLGKPYRLQNHLKEYIDKKGISQAMLAERTGIGASNLSLIMKNKNQPSLDYFFRIWIALECPPLDKILYRVEE
ncbi:helix-turn-helix domain-containing protein [Niallia taxi]|uniref:helix-turn-helix domain-containing protein n=1 Tax=Niallia taxi TaxID=2499688 RepID=UPI003009921E